MKYLLILFLVSCGSGQQTKYRDIEEPGPVVPGPEVSWSEVRPIIDEQCAVSGCHAGANFLQTGAAFKASSSRTLILNGSMPKRSGPNFNLYTPDKKAKLIAYLSN